MSTTQASIPGKSRFVVPPDDGVAERADDGVLCPVDDVLAATLGPEASLGVDAPVDVVETLANGETVRAGALGCSVTIGLGLRTCLGGAGAIAGGAVADIASVGVAGSDAALTGGLGASAFSTVSIVGFVARSAGAGAGAIGTGAGAIG